MQSDNNHAQCAFECASMINKPLKNALRTEKHPTIKKESERTGQRPQRLS
jgi:hypothetical protein